MRKRELAEKLRELSRECTGMTITIELVYPPEKYETIGIIEGKHQIDAMLEFIAEELEGHHKKEERDG